MSYRLVKTKNKPEVGPLALLEIIEKVLRAKIPYTGRGLLSKKVLWITEEICRGYKSSVLARLTSNFIDNFDKIDQAEIRIKNLVNPARSFPIPTDPFQSILDILKKNDLLTFRLVNINAKEQADNNIINRAKKAGYVGTACFVEANKYLEQLFVEVKLFFEQGLLDNKCKFLVGEKIDSEATLKNMEYLTSVDLINIFSNEKIYNPSYEKIRSFIYKQSSSFQLSFKLDKEAKENGAKALWMAYGIHDDLIAAQLLVKCGVDPKEIEGIYTKYSEISKLHLIHLAAYKGHEAFFKILLSRGVDLNIANSDGNIGLHFAAFMGHISIMNIYSKEDILNKRGRNGEVALHIACYDNRINVIEFLFQIGIDPNVCENNGLTALMFASSYNHTDLVNLLLEKGAAIDDFTNLGNNSLSLALKNKSDEAAKVLIDKGIDVEALDQDGGRALHNIVLSKKPFDMASYLLQKGAKINAVNHQENTPLHMAVYNSDHDLTSLFLKNGAEINVKNALGDSPLSFAVFKKNDSIVKLLLEKGANIHIVENGGNTPLHIGILHQVDHELIKLLLKYGADINSINKDGQSPLELSCKNKDWELASLLVENRKIEKKEI